MNQYFYRSFTKVLGIVVLATLGFTGPAQAQSWPDKPIRREHGAEWILLDYSDLVVHVQSAQLRKYYMLDRLWNDCPTIELEAVKEAAANGR